MDCRTHTWREAPPMKVARVFPSTCVLDGKIYVAGGHKNLDSTKWMEVFDTKTQTWEFMQIPGEELYKGIEFESIGYEGTIYLRSRDKNVTYKLDKGRWVTADLEMNNGWGSSSVIILLCDRGRVFYCCNRNGNGVIEWYDSEKRKWTALKKMRRHLPKIYEGNVKLAECGGKMVALSKHVSHVKETTIWCAEITIEKRQNGELWGIVEWFDALYTMNVNEELRLEHTVVTTI